MKDGAGSMKFTGGTRGIWPFRVYFFIGCGGWGGWIGALHMM